MENNEVRMVEEEKLGFKAYKFTNDVIELVIVPEIGGRIMGYGGIGSNILYENPGLFSVKPSLDVKNGEELKALRIKTGYLLYGGEKTWIAPQVEWDGPPYMDLDNGIYAMEIISSEDGVLIKLTSPICRETGIKIIREIRFPKVGTRIEILQHFENHGEQTIKKGLWQVTMIKRPGRVAFPCEGISSYEKGVRIFEEPVYEKADLKIAMGRAIVSCERDNMFKVGTDVNQGYIDTVVLDEIKDTEIVFHEEFDLSSGPYGHGCSVEVYNSKEYPYFEVEIHSPLVTLEPSAFYEYKIAWSLSL